MEPSLPVNTFIISQKTDIENIVEGDVVSFISTEAYMNGSVVTHRVVGIKELDGKICLITRGDANNSVDAAYVTGDNLVGKMVFNTEPDGFFSNAYKFVTNRQVFFIVVIAPMLLVAGILMKNGIQKFREQIDQLKKEIQDDSKEDN
jgi:signal peptidase